jgi:hypothetical protein
MNLTDFITPVSRVDLWLDLDLGLVLHPFQLNSGASSAVKDEASARESSNNSWYIYNLAQS